MGRPSALIKTTRQRRDFQQIPQHGCELVNSISLGDTIGKVASYQLNRKNRPQNI